MSSQGMRTILKRRVDPLKRMRQKFEAGLYDDGYPKSLEILSLNPPLADPPGVSSDVKNRSKLARRVARGERRRRRRGEAAAGYEDDDPNHLAGNIVLPTDRLVRSYLRRNPASVPSYEGRVGIGDVDGYYGYRKGRVTDAFHFAERQREYLLRHHDMRDEVTGELLTRREREERSVRAIEEVLRREDREERFKSRSTAREARREAKDGTPGAAAAAAAAEAAPPPPSSTVNDGSGDEDGSTGPKPGTPSILHGSATTALEMSAWGDRLAHVPYGRWTIGAAASLDHWIATSILGLSERSWQKILEGRTETVSRARDVAAVRTALFPETIEGAAASAGGSALEGEDDDDDAVEIAAESETDRSIDELLASLGAGQDDDDDDIWGEKLGDDDDDDEGEEEEGEIDRWDETDDERLARLKRELRDWQARNHEVRYDDWSEKERKKFNDWLVGYVSTLTAEDDEGAVDMEGTRREIFAEPYFSDERDASMWAALADETDAEMVLRDLLERGHEYLRAEVDGDVSGAEATAMAEREGLAAFLDLPYDEQLHKLRSIGALRPVRDESVPETKVDEFVRDHESVLRDGVVVDRLVPDLRGAITAKDLFGLPVDENRFSYQKTELGGEAERQGASRDAARDAALYRAWGRYRANVANHEEEMFGDDKLGLEYEEKEKEEGTVTGKRP